MNADIEATKRALRAIELNLGVLHDRMAKLRDEAPSGPLKGQARFLANHIEKSIQQLERID